MCLCSTHTLTILGACDFLPLRLINQSYIKIVPGPTKLSMGKRKWEKSLIYLYVSYKNLWIRHRRPLFIALRVSLKLSSFLFGWTNPLKSVFRKCKTWDKNTQPKRHEKRWSSLSFFLAYLLAKFALSHMQSQHHLLQQSCAALPERPRQHMVPSLNTEWCDSLTQRERDRIRGKERQKCLAVRGWEKSK